MGLLQPSSSRGPNRNQLDGDGDGHPCKAQEHAGEPLVHGQGCCVGKLAQELDHDELEDDRAGEDGHEDVVPHHALEHVYLFHLPGAYLIEHLEQYMANQNRIEGA